MALKYNIGNHLHTRINYAVTGSLTAVSCILGHPVCVAIGAIYGASQYLRKAYIQTRLYENFLATHSSDAYKAFRLRPMMAHYCEKMGLNPEQVPLHAAQVDKSKLWQHEVSRLTWDEADSFDETFNTRPANAYAGYIRKPVIGMSSACMEILDDHERFAILGHEFAHVAGRHDRINTLHGGIMNCVTSINDFTRWAGAFSQGVVGPVCGVATYFGVKELSKRMFPALNKRDRLSSEEAHKKSSIERRVSQVSEALATVAVCAFNPAYLGLYAATRALSVSCHLVNRALSRHNEFQADCGAVALGASPLALIRALRKMNEFNDASEVVKLGPALPSKGYLKQAWASLSSTHPSLAIRASRLAVVAAKEGYSSREIGAALFAPLPIPNLPAPSASPASKPSQRGNSGPHV